MDASQTNEPVELFFSYAHEDENLRNELEKHLSILKHQGVITSWHDRRIGAGREWEGEIDSHMNTARVVLLLISPDFMASDYCWDVETKRAMERHTAGEARVIPVILRPVDWAGAPFRKLMALPTDAKPITTWADQDAALLNVARGIRAAVEELTRSQTGGGAVVITGDRNVTYTHAANAEVGREAGDEGRRVGSSSTPANVGSGVEMAKTSLQRQLADSRENLRLIQERKAQYVLETDIPLQLIREERRIQERIADLVHRLSSL